MHLFDGGTKHWLKQDLGQDAGARCDVGNEPLLSFVIERADEPLYVVIHGGLETA